MAYTVAITLRSEDIFVWDTIYVNEWSLLLDLKALLQAFLVVIKVKGLY